MEDEACEVKVLPLAAGHQLPGGYQIPVAGKKKQWTKGKGGKVHVGKMMNSTAKNLSSVYEHNMLLY